MVRERPSEDLVLLAERCHSALRDTRGAAISLAFVSSLKSTMTWLGVGNVEGRVLSGDPSARRPKGSLALGSGVPGHELPSVRTATLDAAARRRPRPGHRRDRGRLRGLARHLRLNSGDQRADPRRPLEAHGRRPGRGGPLPRRSAVSAAAAPGRAPFRAAYASALGDYLRDPSEGSLRVAYELGREAVSRQLSVLDLAVAHQEALLSALAGAVGRGGGTAT